MTLVDAMPRGKTTNSDAYIKRLTEFGKRFRRARPDRNPTQMLLQHDSASRHTSLKTREAATKFGLAVLPPTLQRDLAPLDFHSL